MKHNGKIYSNSAYLFSGFHEEAWKALRTFVLDADSDDSCLIHYDYVTRDDLYIDAFSNDEEVNHFYPVMAWRADGEAMIQHRYYKWLTTDPSSPQQLKRYLKGLEAEL